MQKPWLSKLIVDPHIGWTAVVHEQKLTWDLEGKDLQVKKVGHDYDIEIHLWSDAKGILGVLEVVFGNDQNNDAKYYITGCTGNAPVSHAVLS